VVLTMVRLTNMPLTAVKVTMEELRRVMFTMEVFSRVTFRRVTLTSDALTKALGGMVRVSILPTRVTFCMSTLVRLLPMVVKLT